MEEPNKKRIYAFIDSQNLNLGVRSLDWKIDYKKFRLFLKNKYSVEKAFIFIGMVSNNQKLYTELQNAGFILVFKHTVSYLKDGKETVKGNVDSELVLHAAAIEFPNYDQAIIISGDGDFSCLVEYLIEKEKLLKIFAPNKKYSKLLKPYDKYIYRMDKIIRSIGYKNEKTRTGGRSKP